MGVEQGGPSEEDLKIREGEPKGREDNIARAQEDAQMTERLDKDLKSETEEIRKDVERRNKLREKDGFEAAMEDIKAADRTDRKDRLHREVAERKGQL